MHLNLVLYILATALVLVRCEFKYGNCSLVKDDKIHVYRQVDDGKCLSPNKKVIPKKLAPQPVDKIVELKPAGNYTYEPSFVTVKRCDGECNGGSTPAAVKYVIKKVTVTQAFGEGDSNCVEVDVKEHTQCKCVCELTQANCVGKRVLGEKSCLCECPEKEENEAQSNCKKVGNRDWDHKTCSCGCKEDAVRECMTPQIWDEDICGCRKKNSSKY